MKCRWELIGFLAPFLENFIKILFCRKVKLFTLTKCKCTIMIFCLQSSAMLSVAAINLRVCLYCYLNHSEQATSKKNSNNSKSLTSLATKFSKTLYSFYTMTYNVTSIACPFSTRIEQYSETPPYSHLGNTVTLLFSHFFRRLAKWPYIFL